jgi:hypothetical protein
VGAVRISGGRSCSRVSNIDSLCQLPRRLQCFWLAFAGCAFVDGDYCLPTLRADTTEVIESYPAFVLLYHLDELKVVKAMRAQPNSRLVVVQKGSTVVLDRES